MRSMVEGGLPRLRLRPAPSTAFGGPPPRSGEDFCGLTHNNRSNAACAAASTRSRSA